MSIDQLKIPSLKTKIESAFSTLKTLFLPALLGIAIAIFTFPSISLTYSIGIDAPMMWISSFFFDTQWVVAKDVIFPHGPLAFLVYPTSSNIEYTIWAEALLKIILTIQIVRLIDEKNAYKWLLSFFAAYAIVLLSNFIFLVIFSILLCYCNYFNTTQKKDKYIAFVLTGFAFYIKSYVGIISCIISGSFLLYYLVNTKKYRSFFIDATFLLTFILGLWVGMYGTPSGFFRYCFGLFNLAQDNSSAAAYYPTNNWEYLVPFLVFTFAYPFIYKTPKSLFFAAITTLSLFAAWKHGMAREDVYHIRGTFSYALITFLIFYLFNQKQQLSFLIFGGAALSLFYLNMQNAYAYQNRAYVLFDGISNFTEYFQDLEAIKERSRKASEQNIKSNRLPEKVVQAIGNSTVDVYPWDYTIIPANGFNFQPRPILQSYAAYTSWLDLQDAVHFESSKAPEYLIWDLNKITDGFDHGTMSSLDYRHLLNDEPQTMLSLMKRYELWYKDANYLVYKQRAFPLKTASSIIKTNTTTWSEWTTTPPNVAGLLRAKLSFNKSVLQGLKSFFYKDEQFFVYLKFADQSIQKYRIVPKNAVDGLWINPFVIDPRHPYKQKEVVAIAFDASNKKILTNQLEITWEAIDFVNEPNCPNLFFGKNKRPYPTLVASTQGFENTTDTVWTASAAHLITSEEVFQGKKALRIEPQTYSSAFKIALDSTFVGQKLQITSSCWIKGGNVETAKRISLVCSVINKEKESVLWKNQTLDRHIVDALTWNGMNQTVNYHAERKGEKLAVYVWNNSKAAVFVDDIQVTVQRLEE